MEKNKELIALYRCRDCKFLWKSKPYMATCPKCQCIWVDWLNWEKITTEVYTDFYKLEPTEKK